MGKDPFVKILISLPESLKRFLDDLKRLEGVTVSGYIRTQIEEDRQYRLNEGWNAVIGWKALDDPAYQRRMHAAGKRAEKGYIASIRAHLKRFDAQKATTQDGTRTARKGRKKTS